MSHRGPCGRETPRWSVEGGGQLPAVTASIAGLPVCSAWVGVNPPLFCNGPSKGLVLLRSPGWVNAAAQLPSLLRLLPCDVSLKEQLLTVLLARIVFLRFKTLPGELEPLSTPPPADAVLELIVALISVVVPGIGDDTFSVVAPLNRPPPTPVALVAELPVMVTLVNVDVAPVLS